MNEIAHSVTNPSAPLPGPGATELIERDAKLVMAACFALSEADLRIDGLPAAIANAENILERADSLRRKFRDAMVPAGHDDIAMHLASVVAAFPAGKADEYFGKLLVADVGASAPSLGAIEAACRTLRRSSKFLPAISEVCKAVSDAEFTFRTASEWLEGLPARVARAREKAIHRGMAHLIPSTSTTQIARAPPTSTKTLLSTERWTSAAPAIEPVAQR